MDYNKETLLFLQKYSQEIADIVDGNLKDTLYDFVLKKIRSTSDRPDFAQIVYFLVEKRGCDLGWTETLKVVGSMPSFGWIYRDVEVGNLVWPQEGPKSAIDHMFLSNNTITSLHINKDDFARFNSSAFKSCYNLQSVKIDSCETISYDAFRNCTALQEVILPDGLDALYEGCFVNCPIEVLEIPQSIRWIQENIIGDEHGSYIATGKTKIKIRGMNKEEGREFLNRKVCFDNAKAKARILSKVI